MAQENAQQPESPLEPGVVSYIISPDGEKHVEWIKSALGAVEKAVYRDKDTKKIMHAMFEVNGGVIYLSDGSCLMEQKKKSALPPGEPARGVCLHLNVKDPHPIWKKAMENEATVVVELEKQFWGDVYGSFRDPFGFEWALCSSSTPAPEET